MPAWRDMAVAEAWSLTMARTPMLVPALALTAGILLGEHAVHLWLPAVWLWPAMAVAAAAAVFLCTGRRRMVALTLVWLAAGASGVVLRWQPDGNSGVAEATDQAFGGRVLAVVQLETCHMLTVAIDHADTSSVVLPLKASVALGLGDDEPPRPGDRVKFATTLSRVVSCRDVDGETDPSTQLLEAGIYWQGRVDNPIRLHIETRDRGILAHMSEAGRRLCRLIDTTPMTPATKNFLKAVLAGDRDALLPTDRQLFSSAGVAHILALSGTHVGMIALVANMAMLPLVVFGFRRSRTLLLIMLLWAFAMLTGMSPSVVRSVVMTSVFLAARMLQRRPSPLNSLFLAAMVILLADPSQLHDIGFQLSFAAVGAIVVFADLFYHPSLRRSHPVLAAVAGFVGVSLAANAGTGLVAAWHFHTFPVYFLLSNAVITLVMPPFIALGMIAVAALVLGIPCGAVMWSLDTLHRLVMLTVGWVSSLPGATIDHIYFPGWTFVPYIGILAALRLLTVSRHRHWRRVYAVAMVLCVAVTTSAVVSDMSAARPDEWFVARRIDRTIEVVIRRGSEMWLYTTAGSGDRAGRLAAARRRYAAYAARRGVESMRLLEAGEYGASDIGCDSHGTIWIGQDTLFVASPKTLPSHLPRCCRYFLANDTLRLPMAVGTMHTDTVVAMGNLASSRPSAIYRSVTIVPHTSGSPPWRRPIR